MMMMRVYKEDEMTLFSDYTSSFSLSAAHFQTVKLWLRSINGNDFPSSDKWSLSQGACFMYDFSIPCLLGQSSQNGTRDIIPRQAVVSQ